MQFNRRQVLTSALASTSLLLSNDILKSSDEEIENPEGLPVIQCVDDGYNLIPNFEEIINEFGKPIDKQTKKLFRANLDSKYAYVYLMKKDAYFDYKDLIYGKHILLYHIVVCTTNNIPYNKYVYLIEKCDQTIAEKIVTKVLICRKVV